MQSSPSSIMNASMRKPTKQRQKLQSYQSSQKGSQQQELQDRSELSSDNNNMNKKKSTTYNPTGSNNDKYTNEKHYNIDVIEVSNIALAIKNKEHTINIELAVRCENLPLMKTFGSTDSMIVIYKSNDLYEEAMIMNEKMEGRNSEKDWGQDWEEKKSSFERGGVSGYGNTGSSNFRPTNSNPHKSKLQSKSSYTSQPATQPDEQWLQIGRTQIISNQLNPKFIKTFVFSYNEEKQEKIQFRIYDIVDYTRLDDLNQQVKIGTVTKGMDEVAENDHGEFQVELENKKKTKAILKTSCAEYDSGNSKYEIGLELNNFVGKIQVFYVIQVLKLNEWIPIAKSQSVEIKKNPKFKQTEISYSKFPAEDNSRIKIKVYQISKTKSRHSQELGSTDELTIINILTTDDKTQTQRVYKNGFVVGVVKINKWRKVIRDSFISYIVNGAKLHLILGIDFSNSNRDNGSSLHDIVAGSNPYIEAIRKIIGVLQYFDYYNQIALYGFGAQLPPYYRSVSQCFALNGNYFNPVVVGGVEEIIKLYVENLEKNKLHGPTKLSEMIDLAILYAQAEQNSSNYYVLILMTDGQINDFNETVDRVVKASTLPLSIIIVGIGDKDLGLIQELDSDRELLKSQTGQCCERDIVDFIRLDKFSNEKGDISLARETFAQIPSQFIDYMTKKNIKPNREKKSLKAAKQDFISEKIKQSKNISFENKPIVVIPQFLQFEKKKMKKDLVNLGFDPEDPLLRDLNIAMNDLSYFIEVHSFYKKVVEKRSNITITKIAQKQEKTLEEYLDKKDLQNKKKTLQKLQKIETNQYGRQIKTKAPRIQPPKKEIKHFRHPCLKCKDEEIDFLHMECGHASVCENCLELRCFVCYHLNEEVMRISEQLERVERSSSGSGSWSGEEEEEGSQNDQGDGSSGEDQENSGRNEEKLNYGNKQYKRQSAEVSRWNNSRY